MSKKALYRKYRPTSLDNIIGQPTIVEILTHAIKTKNPSHSYLFTGPRGTGKTSTARIFAHALNNFPYQLETFHLDIIEIDAASHTGVEDIRTIRDAAIISPSLGQYKIYIIDEVHMLSKAAFNALLKILEEPPAHVIFLLATTDLHKVPITITSRVQILNFNLVDLDTITKHLQFIAEQEKINIDQEALSLIASRGGGSFRDSISLLDQISNLNHPKITKQSIIDAFGLPSDLLIDKILSFYKNKDSEQFHALSLEILQSGIRLETLIEELVLKITHNPTPVFLPLLQKLTSITNPFLEAKLILALSSALDLEPSNKPTLEPKSHQPSPAPLPNPSPIKNDDINHEIKPIPKSNPKPQLALKPISNSTDSDFDFEQFKNTIKAKNKLLFSRLQKCQFTTDVNTVFITPNSSIDASILNAPRNLEILKTAIPAGFMISIGGKQLLAPNINQSNSTPSATQSNSISTSSEAKANSNIQNISQPPKNDQPSSPLSTISDIMGKIQEVKINDDIPF